MRRYFLAFSAMLLCTLFVGLSAPSSASAATVYDDVPQIVSNLEVYNSMVSSPEDSRDYSLDWFEETILALQKRVDQNNANSQSAQATIDELYQLISDPHGNWSVILNNSSATSFSIVYSFSEFAQAEFYTFSNDDKVLMLSGQMKQITVYHDPDNLSGFATDNGTLVLNIPWATNIVEYVISSSMIPDQARIFLSTFPVLYPPGYQGVQIPDSYTPIDTTPPEFQFTYAVADKQITLYDLSKLSLGQTACYFQINPNGTQVNTELHFDCDTQNSVTHTVDDYGKYDITLMYVTPDGLKSSIILTLDIDGSSFSDTYGYAVNDIFYKCISSELPFINFTECYNNVLIFANMLAFDRLHFGTDFTPPEGCRNLVVLGDWIGASTNTVCPMIPSYVRDVTTPFVTFLLGLLMLKFITSRSGGGFS